MATRAKLGEILREAGLLDAEGLKRALARKAETGARLGETLVELKVITEEQLYWALSRQLQVPLIPETKLMMVDVPPDVLALLPDSFAREKRVLPLLVEQSKRTISVVTSEPNVIGTLEEIKRHTGMAYVRAFLAKRTAVNKAIDKHYGGQAGASPGDMTDSELILQDLGQGAPPPPSGGPPPPPAGTPPSTPGRPAQMAPPPPPGGPIGKIELERRSSTPPTDPGTVPAPPTGKRGIKTVMVADPDKSTLSGVTRVLATEGYEVEQASTPQEMFEKLKGRSIDLIVVKGTFTDDPLALEQRVRHVFPLIEFRVVQSFATSVLGEPVPYPRLAEFTFDALDQLMSVIAGDDNALRLRARQHAHYGKLVAQRLNAPRKIIDEVYFAGLLEGFGPALAKRRGGENVERSTARQVALNLFANANPPFEVTQILRHIDERHDGSGRPDGLRADQIPLGSRILSVVGEYIDATSDSAGRKGIGGSQAIKLLREMAGRMYDQRIVEAFLSILRNEMMLGGLADGGGKSAGSGEEIMLVDKDVATTSTLEMRLVNEGYRVRVAADGKAALEMAQATPPALIISEIALPKMDGFNLCMELKAAEQTADVPFIFLSAKSDEFNMTKGLEIGADDFLPKPVNVEFLMTKLKRFVQQRPQAAQAQSDGVSGRLAEMGLVEMVQILGVGMKTVKIDLSYQSTGEIFFKEGNIVYCSILGTELDGNEAFYQMATWPADTTFRIAPNEEAPDRNITVGNDFLILEALRRIDEGAAGISQAGKSGEVGGKAI